MRGKALLFGLNYAHCKQGQLKGCVNDVYIMSKYIQSLLNIPIDIYTDDVDIKSTSYDGIVQKLYDLALQSVKEDLEFVWIHYSGHGSSQKDTSGDEADGMDEGLVPSDFERKGILIDDIIHNILASFNPKTKILFICDACHSGSILDLKYTWDTNMKCKVDNKKDYVKSNTLLISGCQDNQTSADAFNLLGDNKSVGALTASILKVLRVNPNFIQNAFRLVQAVRKELKLGNFTQYPNISSNYNLLQNASLIPLPSSQTQVIPNPNNTPQPSPATNAVTNLQEHVMYYQPQCYSAPPQSPQSQYAVQQYTGYHNNPYQQQNNPYYRYNNQVQYYPQQHHQVQNIQNTRDVNSSFIQQNSHQYQPRQPQYIIVQLPPSNRDTPRPTMCQM